MTVVSLIEEFKYFPVYELKCWTAEATTNLYKNRIIQMESPWRFWRSWFVCRTEGSSTFFPLVSWLKADGQSCPMTCQSSESTDTIESDRRASDASRAVESDESRIATAMKDLKNTGWLPLHTHSVSFWKKRSESRLASVWTHARSFWCACSQITFQSGQLVQGWPCKRSQDRDVWDEGPV